MSSGEETRSSPGAKVEKWSGIIMLMNVLSSCFVVLFIRTIVFELHLTIQTYSTKMSLYVTLHCSLSLYENFIGFIMSFYTLEVPLK